MRDIRQGLRRGCAILIGLVLLSSGILKLMDPVGARLIVEAYLGFLHLGFLRGAATVFGFGLSLVEACTGAALITGAYRRAAAACAGVLLAVFTLMTFFLWLLNPQMDCGCFGEALHLTHLQSFLKNVVLDLLWLVAFLPMRDLRDARGHKYVCFWVAVASLTGFGVYSLLEIPLVDFTQFTLSSRLQAAEETDPAGAGNDQVVVFIYEKNGHQGSFTLDALPDSSWTFVRQDVLAKEDNYRETGYPQLSLRDASGAYCDSVAAAERVLLVSVYEPARLGEAQWQEAERVLRDAAAAGMTPVLAVAAAPGDVPAGEYLYYSDFKTLVALNRSNGGAVYFNEGDLIQKWSRRHLPALSKLQGIVSGDATETMISASTRGSLRFQAFCLYLLALLVIL